MRGALLETLRRISGLPDALGRHPCECGHPEMRRLPDGTFHCPGCGSEVLPPDEPGEAYRAGWLDGCFGEGGGFVNNPNLARWGEPSERLEYYRGHRAGSEARWTSGGPGPGHRDESLGKARDDPRGRCGKRGIGREDRPAASPEPPAGEGEQT